MSARHHDAMTPDRTAVLVRQESMQMLGIQDRVR
jgi:hypothetical protein